MGYYLSCVAAPAQDQIQRRVPSYLDQGSVRKELYVTDVLDKDSGGNISLIALNLSETGAKLIYLI